VHLLAAWLLFLLVVSPLQAVLNLTHTVAQLHALIGAHDPAAVAQPYVLSAGFPPAQLADPSATIEAAGLAGAQVTQKLV
jgi:UBX domain-containing protein 1